MYPQFQEGAVRRTIRICVRSTDSAAAGFDGAATGPKQAFFLITDQLIGYDRTFFFLHTRDPVLVLSESRRVDFLNWRSECKVICVSLFLSLKEANSKCC